MHTRIETPFTYVKSHIAQVCRLSLPFQLISHKYFVFRTNYRTFAPYK